MYAASKQPQRKPKPRMRQRPRYPNRKYSNPDNEIRNQRQQKLRNSERKIPENVQIKLQDLIVNFEDGIWCSQLPTEYKLRFKEELNFERFGYIYLIHMCMDLPHIFNYRKESFCDYKLYDKRMSMPEITESLENPDISTSSKEQQAIVTSSDWNAYRPFLPAGIVELGYEIPKDFISGATRIGDNLCVVVSEIYDPSKFWLHIDDHYLRELRNDMESFYSENKKYMIPEYLLEINLTAVCFFRNEFARSIIIEIMKDLIKVYLIDYGTVCNVPKTELWFLTEQFAKLPAQSIRARLANIHPPYKNFTWSKESTREFREYVKNAEILAEICRIDLENGIIEVKIKKYSRKFVFSINEILVEKKLAKYTSHMRLENHPYDEYLVPNVENIHLFPEFWEIENGNTLSASDVDRFADSDISSHFFYPQYFARKCKSMNEVESNQCKIDDKTRKLTKYLREDECKVVNFENVVKAMYGPLFNEWEEDLRNSMQEADDDFNHFSNEKSVNEFSSSHCAEEKLIDVEFFQKLEETKLIEVESFSQSTKVSLIDMTLLDFSRSKLLDKNNNDRDINECDLIDLEWNEEK